MASELKPNLFWGGGKEAPDLQKLERHYGGYSKIPSEAWAEYDYCMLVWKALLRAGEYVEKEKGEAKASPTF